MNKWSKYIGSASDYGYYKHLLDNILQPTRLRGFIPCSKMKIGDGQSYKITDVFEAFSIMDQDGKKWNLNFERQIELINSAYDITFAWIIAGEFSIDNVLEARPTEAHLIVKMPEVTIKYPHYRTRNADECLLGTYYVEIYYPYGSSRGYPSIKFWQKLEWIDGSDYYVAAIHPHISNGAACWGDMKTNSYDPIKSGNLLGSLTSTRIFLNTYNKDSPYAPMQTWQNEVNTFRLDGTHMFQIGKSDLEVHSIHIPRANSNILNDEELYIAELEQLKQNEGSNSALLLEEGVSLTAARSNYGITYQEQQYMIGIPMLRQLMPLIVRLVLYHDLGWIRALFIAIKAAYYEWKALMSSAPKRWPQGVIKKSDFNVLRHWANRPDDSKYYEMPGFYRWTWSNSPHRLEKVSAEELHIHDIKSFISDIDTIRGRSCSFDLSGNGRGNHRLSDNIYQKISDPDYILGFRIYAEDEYAIPNKQNKRLVCRKLREDINALDGLYQNAKYKQNKRFIEIIDKEKEIVQNEANNYCPVATKDKLPFESL